jgi:hypothetical protein
MKKVANWYICYKFPLLFSSAFVNKKNVCVSIHTHTHSGLCYNERCYNVEFLSIKSECYKERGVILSADVARA